MMFYRKPPYSSWLGASPGNLITPTPGKNGTWWYLVHLYAKPELCKTLDSRVPGPILLHWFQGNSAAIFPGSTIFFRLGAHKNMHRIADRFAQFFPSIFFLQVKHNPALLVLSHMLHRDLPTSNAKKLWPHSSHLRRWCARHHRLRGANLQREQLSSSPPSEDRWCHRRENPWSSWVANMAYTVPEMAIGIIRSQQQNWKCHHILHIYIMCMCIIVYIHIYIMCIYIMYIYIYIYIMYIYIYYVYIYYVSIYIYIYILCIYIYIYILCIYIYYVYIYIYYVYILCIYILCIYIRCIHIYIYT